MLPIHRVIYEYLRSAADDGKMMLTGVQVVGVAVANRVDPYNPSTAGTVTKQE